MVGMKKFCIEYGVMPRTQSLEKKNWRKFGGDMGISVCSPSTL